jgi:hypothetical protein
VSPASAPGGSSVRLSKKKAAETPISTAHDLERDFVFHIRHRAEAHGWLVYHHPDSRFSFSNGFPDLVLVHPVRQLLAFECKTDVGRFSEDQSRWIDGLIEARPENDGYAVEIWRPTMAAWIDHYLTGGMT